VPFNDYNKHRAAPNKIKLVLLVAKQQLILIATAAATTTTTTTTVKREYVDTS
jgi:hypothetical protein